MLGKNINYKLYFKCIMLNTNFSFIEKLAQYSNSKDVFIPTKYLYFVALHLRFSSLFYSSQLVDIFSYEVPCTSDSHIKSGGGDLRLNNKNSVFKQGSGSVVVYNFHILQSQTRIFVFVKGSSSLSSKANVTTGTKFIQSLSEIFFAANWLEREVSELSGVSFLGKKDIRNLMLQYGDSSTPFKKSYPSIGTTEMFYNPIKDTLTQNPVSVQI